MLLGLVYPLAITASARLWPDKANGQLITRNGAMVGSRILAQPFTGPAYFHPRPSAAGTNGYAAENSSGSNLGPTNQKLIDRVKADVATLQSENPGQPVPNDLVTTSGSGLDRTSRRPELNFRFLAWPESGTSEEEILKLVQAHTEKRQFGFLGEPRVNVLELNLVLDEKFPAKNSLSNTHDLRTIPGNKNALGPRGGQAFLIHPHAFGGRVRTPLSGAKLGQILVKGQASCRMIDAGRAASICRPCNESLQWRQIRTQGRLLQNCMGYSSCNTTSFSEKIAGWFIISSDHNARKKMMKRNNCQSLR